jgi:polyisoprenoid-binding protein YceI
MRTPLAVAAAIAGVAIVAAVVARTTAQSTPPAAPADASQAGAYQIDPVHSGTVFSITHFGVSNFWGRFNEISGTYTFDPAKPDAATFDVTIRVESVDTNNKRRDDHLRSPDFFNAVEYPTISFKSTKAEKATGNSMVVTGDLTMHGQTRPISATVKFIDAKSTPQGFKSGLEARFAVKRTDFGMDTYVANGGLGDEVNVVVALEGVKR